MPNRRETKTSADPKAQKATCVTSFQKHLFQKEMLIILKSFGKISSILMRQKQNISETYLKFV